MKTAQAGNHMGTAGISGLVLKTGTPLMISLLINSLYKQVVLPVVFIAVFSRFGNVQWIWMSFVLSEAVVIPAGMFLWRRESGRVLNHLEGTEHM